MSKRKYSKSFEIALSAISCAVAVVFLAIGFFSEVLLATGYLLGIIALMVPLSKQFYLGGFLAYVGTCILTLVLGAAVRFWDLVPFIMFFGLHPLVNCLQIRFKINKWVAYIVKALWFIGTLFTAYFLVFEGFIGTPSELFNVINKYIYVIIPVGGAVLFYIYDYMIFKFQIMVNALVYRIRK